MKARLTHGRKRAFVATMPEDPLKELRDAVAELAEVDRLRAKQIARRDKAVRRVLNRRRQIATAVEVAAITGLTPQRVGQIKRGTR